MLVVLLTVFGFTFPSPPPDTSCVEVVHQFRAAYRLEVAAAQSVGDRLVYLLVDKSRNKTAEVVCAFPD